MNKTDVVPASMVLTAWWERQVENCIVGSVAVSVMENKEVGDKGEVMMGGL